MADREVWENEIAIHLELLFNEKLPQYRHRWAKYKQESAEDKSGAFVKVFTDKQEVLPYTPAIEIVENDSDLTQISIGSQHEKFNFDILISVTNAHPTESKKFLSLVARCVIDILNQYENRAFNLPPPLEHIRLYDSYAGTIEWGFRKGKAFRTAKIPWFAQLFKPDRRLSTGNT